MDQTELIPKPIFILQNTNQINCLLFSNQNKNILYAGYRNGDVTVYDLQLRRSLYSANPNNQPILSIVELDKNNFISHSRNGLFYKWTKLEEKKWQFSCIYEKEAYTFCQFSLSNDKNILFIPGKEVAVIDCIDLITNKKTNEIRPKLDSKTNRGMLMNMKILNSNLLLSGYENGELALFDLKSFNELASIDLFSGQPLICFDYCDRNNLGFCGSAEDELKQFTINKEINSEIVTYKFELKKSVKLVNPGINSIKIRSSDSKIFACGCWDSRVRIYSLKKLNLLAVLDFHKEAINTIDFSSDNLMAAGSNDGVISFWNLYN